MQSQPEPSDPLAKLLGFKLEVDERVPPGAAVLIDPRDRRVLGAVVNTAHSTELAVRTAAPTGVKGERGELSEDPSAAMAEARLFGNLNAIMHVRGMAATVVAVQRQLRRVAEDARAQGRSTEGFIG